MYKQNKRPLHNYTIQQPKPATDKMTTAFNESSFATLTFGDQAENHAGMQILGQLAEKGDGFSKDDLLAYQAQFESLGATCDFVPLFDSLKNVFDGTLDGAIDGQIKKEKYEMEEQHGAAVLVIRNGVNILLSGVSAGVFGGEDEFTADAVFRENAVLDLDKKAWMRGRVVNKHARWNVCFDEVGQEPDYEEKRGRIVPYDSVPATKMLRTQFARYFGEKAANLKGEGNYYYDRQKCGIGFHGDSERRKVIGVRLSNELGGETPPLHFQWFLQTRPIGERIVIPLNAGDIYLMSEKAVGTDWKCRSKCTLRHATGSSIYTNIKPPKVAKSDK